MPETQVMKKDDGELGAWRSIETAPKGKVQILAYFPSMNTIFQCLQRDDGAWYTGFGERLDNPTHWQPAIHPTKGDKPSGILR